MQKTVLKQTYELNRMSMGQLRKRWADLLGTDPGRLGRRYLIRRLAYRIQELAYGGLADETKAELERIAEEDEAKRHGARANRRKPKVTHPTPGTRLVREWNGQRHEVTAIEGGFEYSGRRYKSLSAIAKAITGAHWSGPQFFGLRTPKEAGR